MHTIKLQCPHCGKSFALNDALNKPEHVEPIKQFILPEDRTRLRQQIVEEVCAEQRLRDLERENLIVDLRSSVQALQLKLAVSSQQAAGEMLEVELLDSLSHSFPQDQVERVAKGRNDYVTGPEFAVNEEFLILTMPAIPRGRAKVQPGRGVKVHTAYYWDDQMRGGEVEGTLVPVRYDPFDVGHVYALVNKNWVRCFTNESKFRVVRCTRFARSHRCSGVEIRSQYAIARWFQVGTSRPTSLPHTSMKKCLNSDGKTTPRV